MRTTRITSESTRRGTSATEFAVALPLLMMMALATTDFGRAFYFREAVSNAARVGAARAAGRGFTAFTRTAWEADVREAVLAELENLPAYDEDDVEMQLTVADETSELFRAAVEVTYPFRTVVSWPGLPHVVEIRERVEMQRFR